MSETVACPPDEQRFHRVIHAIEQRLKLLDRLPRVRINAWIKKLRDEVSGNATWQRNRNCYARLLLEQLRAGCLEVPFNAMPPEGSLPTLPSYLMYRFFSPPKQQHSTYRSLGYMDAECSPDSTLAGCATAGLARPHSAGAAAAGGSHTFRQLPAGGAHDSWRVVWGSAMPTRCCGSPPSTRNVALQQQQQWHSGSPRSVRSAGSGQRCYSSGKGSPQRSRSPGAAGLLDAAAVVAAEMEAEREEALRMSSRLRFAEDKLLQQEAELVRLQSAASTARRRIKSATSATLQELLERYGAAAAAWTGAAAGSTTGASGVLADDVYKPVWQLLAGLQSVLDSCDQQEHEWVRAKGSAAAAAIEAACQAQEAAAAAGGSMYPSWDGATSTGTAAADSLTEGLSKQTSQRQQPKGVGQFASEAAAAAAAEAAVLKHCEQCMLELQHQAEQLVAGLAVKKDEATAAAGGRGAAADVAEAAAQLLKPMLKALRREARDANKLRKRLEAAAEATDAAAASASSVASAAAKSALKLQKSLLRHEDDKGSSSSSSGSGSDSSTSDGEGAASSISSRSRSSRLGKRRQLRHEQKVLASAEQQQQHQGARLQRLQSASQVLMELDKASAKLELQMKEAQQRMQDMAVAGAATGAAHHYDNGLVAAGTAGLAASLSAGLRAFHSTSNNLCHLIQSLRSAAAEAAVAASRASEGGRSTGGGSQQQQQQRGSSLLRSALSTPRGEQNVHFSQHDSSGGSSKAAGAAGSSPAKLLSRSASSRLGDAALAGTWGEQEAASPAAIAVAGASNGQLLSRSEYAVSAGGSAYDATAHYLIGAAAAAPAAANSASRATAVLSPRGGPMLSVNPEAAAATAEGWRVLWSAPSSPRTLSLGHKAAFAEQLQGSSGSGVASGSSLSGGSSPPGGDAAAEAVHAVHTQLAGLSRQASRLSLKANAMLASSGADAAVAAAGDFSSSGGLRVLSGASSLSGSLRQREARVLGAGVSPFTAASLSPRGAGSPAVGIGLGGLGNSSALGSSATSPPAAGSLLSSATRSALLGQGGRGVGLGATGLGNGVRPSLVSSYSSSLLKGGNVGVLSGTSSAFDVLGAGRLLRRAGAGLGKLGVQSAPGIPAGSSSSLAAISSRLHSLTNVGR